MFLRFIRKTYPDSRRNQDAEWKKPPGTKLQWKNLSRFNDEKLNEWQRDWKMRAYVSANDAIADAEASVPHSVELEAAKSVLCGLLAETMFDVMMVANIQENPPFLYSKEMTRGDSAEWGLAYSEDKQTLMGSFISLDSTTINKAVEELETVLKTNKIAPIPHVLVLLSDLLHELGHFRLWCLTKRIREEKRYDLQTTRGQLHYRLDPEESSATFFPIRFFQEKRKNSRSVFVWEYYDFHPAMKSDVSAHTQIEAARKKLRGERLQDAFKNGDRSAQNISRVTKSLPKNPDDYREWKARVEKQIQERLARK